MQDKFNEIGLRLDISNTPITWGGDPVFQMTINRTPRGIPREEWFEMFIPANAKVEVIATDEKRQQVVVSVQEEANTFETDPTAFYPVNGRKSTEEEREIFFTEFINRMNRFTNEIKRSDIVQNEKGKWVIMRHSPARKRHFLMGKDERQLFICQLPTLAKTIQEAFQSLKHPTVILAEGKNKNVIRQGEWFFINATGLEMEKIKLLLSSNKIDIKHNQNIGAIVADRAFVQGNPHTADEIVVIPAKMIIRGFTPARENEIFVRGCVRHHDHKTIVCGNWRKVLRNTEVEDTSAAITGWID